MDNIFQFEDQILVRIKNVSYDEEEAGALHIVGLLLKRRSTLLIDFSSPVEVDLSLENAKRRAGFFQVHSQIFQDRCIATAIVLETGPRAMLKKALLQALFVVVKPMSPLKIFSDVRKANEWLEEMRGKE